jgi:DNA-binding NarL/FixJ family response regulator
VAIRTALVIENLLRREGLRSMLSLGPEFEVFEVRPREPDLLAALGEIEPEVVVADAVVSDPEQLGGVELAAEIAQRGGGAVILLGANDSVAAAPELAELGMRGRGYLVENHLRHRSELVDAIRLVVGGRSAFDRSAVAELATRRTFEDLSPLSRLTLREREVLSEVASGLSNAAIADLLGITKRAVERHIASIFRKCALSRSSDEIPRVAVTLLYLRSHLAAARAVSLADDARALEDEARAAREWEMQRWARRSAERSPWKPNAGVVENH